MSYTRTDKKYGSIEQIIRQYNIHEIEDTIRYIMLVKGIFTKYDIILIARILHGRILNASYSSIDPRHSKSQLITLLCIAFSLSSKKKELDFKLNRNLFNLLKYHQRIISDFIYDTDINSLNIYDLKHYEFCKKCYPYIDLLIYHMNLNDNDILEINFLKKYLVSKLPINNNKAYKTLIENKKFAESLKNLDISLFMTQ